MSYSAKNNKDSGYKRAAIDADNEDRENEAELQPRKPHATVFLLGALQRERSQGSAQRPQDPLETENTQKENYNHVTTTNKCRNANSQIVH